LIEAVSAIILSSGSPDADIERCMDDVISEINNQIMNLSKNIERDLSIKVDDFSKEFQSLTAEYEAIHVSENHDGSDKTSLIPDEVKHKTGEILKDKRMIEEGAKQVLLQAKKFLPKDIMHGKGPVWMGKAAGKFAIGVSVAVEVYNVYSAHNEHQKMIEAERNRTIGARNSAVSLADNLQASLFNSIDEVINDTFNDLILHFKDASKKRNCNHKSLLEQKENLQSVLNLL